MDATGVEGGVHNELGWGNAEFPFIPFESAYYERNTSLLLRMVNLSGSENQIFPTFVTRRISHVPDWW